MDEKDSENEKNTLYKKQTQQWIVASRWTQVTNNTIKASSTKSQNGHYVFLIYFFIIIPVGNFFVSSHHQGARPGGVHLFYTLIFLYTYKIFPFYSFCKCRHELMTLIMRHKNPPSNTYVHKYTTPHLPFPCSFGTTRRKCSRVK